MCHAFLQSHRFHRLLLDIDESFASEARSCGCVCGGTLHRADYPRKPRACPSEVRTAFESRFSFCCNRCRRRTTSMSVRFLGRRVYLSLAVVLASARLAGQRPTVARLSDELNIPMRTLERWRQWWRQQFPLTPLWRAQCARFMPPVDTALAEGIAALGAKPVLHGDNGATLKATTVLAMLNWLGVKPSYSRPRVSDDNAYAEALFRTAKYRPEFPAQGFADLDQARTWAAGFVHWYNVEHRHSGIRYVSPAQRHAGDDQAILAARHALYLQARQLNPARWSGGTRNWAHIAAVTLNPERDSVIKAQLAEHDIQPLAA